MAKRRTSRRPRLTRPTQIIQQREQRLGEAEGGDADSSSSVQTSLPVVRQGTTTLCGPVPAGKMSAAICRDWEDPATGDYLVDREY